MRNSDHGYQTDEYIRPTGKPDHFAVQVWPNEHSQRPATLLPFFMSFGASEECQACRTSALTIPSGHPENYALANPLVCSDASIRTNAPTTGAAAVNVVTEHPLERVTLRDFGEYAQRGTLDILDGTAPRQTQLRTVPFDILAHFLNNDYRRWPNVVPGHALPGSAAEDVADALGSTSNPDVLANLEENLNGVKARV